MIQSNESSKPQRKGLTPSVVSSTSSLESEALERPVSKGDSSTIDAIISGPTEAFAFPDNHVLPPVANPLATSSSTIPSSPAPRVEASPPPPPVTTSAPQQNQPSFAVTQSHIRTAVPRGRMAQPIPSAAPKSLPIPVPIMPSLPSTVGKAQVPQPSNNTVAEFLYQLTKMLTDDNKEVIEWSNGKIEVHSPIKLASDVLHKYFRHSKFASFQRQLNYFGFRKLAGKGKMAPCSYVNEATTDDLRSILAIKRKTSATSGKEKGSKKRGRAGQGAVASTAPINPVLAGILQKTAVPTKSQSVTTAKVAVGKGVKHQLNGYLRRGSSQADIAKAAVGKGVRHGYSIPPISGAPVNKPSATKTEFTFQDPHQLGMDIQSSLSELNSNYQNCLNSAAEGTTSGSFESMLKRNDSLVDLAMIPSILEESIPPPVSVEVPAETHEQAPMMTFVDFPHEEMNPENATNQ